MPFDTSHYPQVVVFNGKVYIGGGSASSTRERQTVIVYDPQQDTWDTLPPYTHDYFSIAVVNNQLVLVGGLDEQTVKKTNKLGVWNEQSRQWTHPLPPMITACNSPSVASHNNRWLVVIGGFDDGGTKLSRVEILDTESRQWYHAAPLPQPCSYSLLVTIGKLLTHATYWVASVEVVHHRKCLVYIWTISSVKLFHNQQVQVLHPHHHHAWQTLPDTPWTGSTALAINGALLAV